MTSSATLSDPYRLTLYGQPVAGITIDPKALNSRLRKLFDQDPAAEKSPTLAYIKGYKAGPDKIVLPDPILLVMVGGGEEASGWDKRFPGESHRMWTLDVAQPSSRFDVTDGNIDDLLDGLEDDGAGDGAEGGLTLRGADGRLYFVPGSLDHYEVMEEDTKSELLLSKGTDLADVKVREILCDSEVASRAAMAS
ncbi:MAG: hypothetical protein V3R55_00240, partial [Alphaproteobacteria bacterium]